ncbi:MAG: MerR family transcriptional regulator [Candidatus Binataceae bacterium]
MKPRRVKSRPRPKVAADSSRPAIRIGQAARIIRVKPFVLRFWETQFAFLRPAHAGSSHRLYRPEDIEKLKLVKRLLHEERFTIEGAKKHIREVGLEGAQAAKPSTPANSPGLDHPTRQTLVEIRRQLEDLHRLLER